MIIRRNRILRTLLLAATFSSCRGSSAPVTPTAPAPVASVQISGFERYTFQPGLRAQFVATLTQNAGSEDCTSTAAWGSSNDQVIRLTGRAPGEFLVTGVGDASISAVCANVTGRAPLRVNEPTSWPVSGRIVAAPDGAVLASATVSLAGYAPLQSDESGHYALKLEDRNTHTLLVTLPGFLSRETFLRGGELRELDIDLIGSEPLFPLKMWREMVRNARDQPPNVPGPHLARWTQNPNFYLRTMWRNSPDKAVGNIPWFIDEIRRVVPILTAGQFQAGQVETGAEERPPTPGWINISFDSSATASSSQVGQNPGRVLYNFDSACNYYVVMHELGHAMGFTHTSAVPSLMGNAPRFCSPFAINRDEELIIRTAYSRPVGNAEPDRDPEGSYLLQAVQPAIEPVVSPCPDSEVGRD